MQCREVNQYLDRAANLSAEALPAHVHRHIERCSACSRLWRFLTTVPPSGGVATDLCSRIQKHVLHDLRPVRPLPGAIVITLAFLSIFAALSILFGLLMGAAAAAAMTTLQFGAVLVLIGGGAVLLAAELSREMAPGTQRLLPAAALYPFLLLLLFLLVYFLFPWQAGENLLRSSWMCFQAGLVFSLSGAALIVLVLSRGMVLSFKAAGAGAGLLAGLLGVAALHLSCPVATAPHIAVGHLSIPLAGTAVGYLLGWLVSCVAPVFRWRPREE